MDICVYVYMYMSILLCICINNYVYIYIYIHDRIHICVVSLVFPGNSQKKHPEICVLKLRLRLFGFFGFLLHMFFSCLVRMRQNQRAPRDPSYFIHPVGLTNVLANWMLSIC